MTKYELSVYFHNGAPKGCEGVTVNKFSLGYNKDEPIPDKAVFYNNKRHISIHPFSCVEEDWSNVFEKDLDTFREIFDNDNLMDLMFNADHPSVIDFHYGIWDFDKAYASSTEESANVEKYKGYRFMILSLPYIVNSFWEQLKNYGIYYNSWYSDESKHIIYFKVLSVELFQRLFTMILNLNIIGENYRKAIQELEEKYKIENKIEETVLTELKNYAL